MPAGVDLVKAGGLPVEGFVPTRSCGDCRLCCKVLEVYDLKKPRGEWCKHACSTGCSIYETRPTDCRTFTCLWLVGLGLDEEERPDKLRVVFTPAGWEVEGKIPTTVRQPATGKLYNCIAAHEAYQGAGSTERALASYAVFLEQGLAVAVNFTRCHRIYFPDRTYVDISPSSADAKLSPRVGYAR